MSRFGVTLWITLLLVGCQSTHDQMLREGYPPPYADGFQDGCGSGRQAAALLAGSFRKNVPRYLHERAYENGWDDGFRQCQAIQDNADQRQYRERFWDERDRDWQQEKDRGAARAYRHD